MKYGALYDRHYTSLCKLFYNGREIILIYYNILIIPNCFSVGHGALYDFGRRKIARESFIAWLTDDSSCREFEVDSLNFAGQTHRWRLSGLLQRGRDRRRDALLTDLALATRFLVVTAKARLVSHCFSVSQSLKALLTGLLRLLGEQFASSACM